MSASTQESVSPTRLLLVTGRLAEELARQVVQTLNEEGPLQAEVQVVGISVAALMHVEWLKRKLTIEGRYDRVIVPGWCQGDLTVLEAHFGMPFERGPKDVLDLPAYLCGRTVGSADLSAYDIEILAEINHAPRMSLPEILQLAERYREAGADIIDVGCIPGESWQDVADVVHALRQTGHRVSIDSFDRREVESAVAAGAELVLSCNSSNVDWAIQLDAELVLIPDDPARCESLWATVETVAGAGKRYRLDPILEPIGFGFAASLARYYDARSRFPDTPIMMGIGNLTEMTEVDSAGLNLLLAAICQELGIHSVLTTEVINWARTSVAEFDKARRLVKHAIDHRKPPKRLSHELVILRDPRLHELGEESLTALAGRLKDPNFRIFVERGEIHIMNRDGYWRGRDAFELFDTFSRATKLDAAHAFYLGYELSKAITALTLGKAYQQDEALRWGFLTVPEASPHERRRREEAT